MTTTDAVIIGHILSINGEAYAAGEGESARPLEQHNPVYEGDALTTADNARMEIEFTDGTIVSQGQNAQINLVNYAYSEHDPEESSLSFKLTAGTIRLVSGKIAEDVPGNYELATPQATIDLTGTRLFANVGESGTDVGVEQMDPENSVVVQTEAGTVAILRTGQNLGVALDGTMTDPGQITPELLEQIQSAAPMTTLGESLPGNSTDEGQEQDVLDGENADAGEGDEDIDGDAGEGGDGEDGEDDDDQDDGDNEEEVIDQVAEAGDVGEAELAGEAGQNGEVGDVGEAGDEAGVEENASPENTSDEVQNFTYSAENDPINQPQPFSTQETITEFSQSFTTNPTTSPAAFEPSNTGSEELNQPANDFETEDDEPEENQQTELENDNQGTAPSNQEISGTSGDDDLTGTDDADSIYGNGGNDNLLGEKADDQLFGGDDSDTLYGGEGNDSLYGENGNDLIKTGPGNEHIDGGISSDTLSFAQGAALQGVVYAIGDASVTDQFGSTDNVSNFENVIGSVLDDKLTGDTAANILVGGAGNDTIAGGDGVDQLDGGTGSADLLDFSQEGGSQGADANLSTGAVNDTFGNAETAQGFENVTGSDNGDNLIGDSAANALIGGAGNDTIAGGDGVDQLDGGTGSADMLDFSQEGGSQNVTVDLAAGTATDTYGNAENVTGFENVTGTANGDSISGDDVENLISGGDGDDTLFGGLADDTIFGEAGNDLIKGGSGSDSLDGGTGVNTLSFTGGNQGITYTIGNANVTDQYGQIDIISNFTNVIGSDYDDVVFGNGANNIIKGGGGDDTLYGAGGDDTIYASAGGGIQALQGNAGNDLLFAGTSTDHFLFSSHGAANADAISNFQANQDKIYLKGSVFTGLATAGNAVTATSFVSKASTGAAPFTGQPWAYIVYVTSTDKLYYDANGSDGFQYTKTIATISTAPDVAGGDIIIF